MPLTIVADQVQVPVVGRARTSTANDPEVVSFYNDSLKPRGVPTPDGQAIKLRFETKAEAEKILRALRKIGKEDMPPVSISADLQPETYGLVTDSPHLLTVWIRGPFSPRKDKEKDDAATEAVGAYADAVADAVESRNDPLPTEDAPVGSGTEDTPFEAVFPDVEDESHVEPAHGKNKRWHL